MSGVCAFPLSKAIHHLSGFASRTPERVLTQYFLQNLIGRQPLIKGNESCHFQQPETVFHFGLAVRRRHDPIIPYLVKPAGKDPDARDKLCCMNLRVNSAPGRSMVLLLPSR